MFLLVCIKKLIYLCWTFPPHCSKVFRTPDIEVGQKACHFLCPGICKQNITSKYLICNDIFGQLAIVFFHAFSKKTLVTVYTCWDQLSCKIWCKWSSWTVPLHCTHPSPLFCPKKHIFITRTHLLLQNLILCKPGSVVH